ncbi:cingulin-like [Polyodon spathula]|uniref:cingulin-like n=2 Tax=Polyodon spathula TaxID=7913 RepID=UPI001B7E80B9|nr:cingulin-like [Polyodon spathula]
MEKRLREMEQEWLRGEMRDKMREIKKKLRRDLEKKHKREVEELNKEMEKKWNEMEELKKEMEEKQKEMEKKQKEMEKKQKEMEKKQKEMEEKQKEMEKKLRDMKEILREVEEYQKRDEEEQRREEPEEIHRRIKCLKGFVQMYQNEKPQVTHFLTELNRIADELDEGDRKATIAKTIGSSVSVVGGVMAVAGLALALFTWGATLGLVPAGAGVTVTGGVFNVSVEIAKGVRARDKNKRLEETVNDINSKMKALGGMCYTKLANSYRGYIGSLLIGIYRKTRAALGLSDDVAAIAVGLAVDVPPSVISDVGRALRDPCAGVFAAVDALNIALNIRKLIECHPTEKAQEIRYLVKSLKESQLAELDNINSDINMILNKYLGPLAVEDGALKKRFYCQMCRYFINNSANRTVALTPAKELHGKHMVPPIAWRSTTMTGSSLGPHTIVQAPTGWGGFESAQ